MSTTREDYQKNLADTLGDLLINWDMATSAPTDTKDPKPSPAVITPFVPCANLLLGQVYADSEMKAFFEEYFVYGYHEMFPGGGLDPEYLKHLSCAPDDNQRAVCDAGAGCLPPSCVKMGGIRGSAEYCFRDAYSSGSSAAPGTDPTAKIIRLFIGDLVWVFYMERMGLFRMFAKLVDDYASAGQYPVESGSITGVTLEVMVRQLKTGMASSVRDRTATYRRCLGWTSDVGTKLEMRTEVSTAFNEQFHQFIQTALKYNEDKRLAKAIQLTTTGASSAATRVSIAETLILLKESFKVFGYGRNYYNTLNAIVYAIAALDLIRNVRAQIGIPSSYTTASQYVSAAYYMLIEGKAASESRPNRYIQHLACARAARDLLLDIDKLDASDTDAVGTWLDNEIIEERIEIYRKAYRDLTKIDLLQSVSRIEQQA